MRGAPPPRGQVVSGDGLAAGTDAIVGYPGCSTLGYAGPEMAWTFVPTEDTKLIAKVDSDVDMDVFLLEGDECDADECVAWNSVNVIEQVTAGTKYWIVVDGSQGADAAFELSIDCCTANCDGKTCGSNGCGGQCGVCSSEQVCQFGACVTPPAPTCVTPDTIACGETGETELTATQNIWNYACSAPDFTNPGPEGGWAFQVDVPTRVTATLDQTPDKPDADLFVLEGECHADACVASQITSVTFDAAAGVPYHIVADTESDFAPVTAELTVTCCELQCGGGICGVDDGCGGICGCPDGDVCTDDTCCTPDCSGGCEGDDGCGGTCECAQGDQCVDGQCATLPTTCTPSETITCGQTLSDQSTGSPTASFAFPNYPCQVFFNDFSKSPELVYEFHSETAQEITIKGSGDGTLMVTLLEDVGNGCEATLQTCKKHDFDTIVWPVKSDTTYYIVWDNTTGAVVNGFDVTLTCDPP